MCNAPVLARPRPTPIKVESLSSSSSSTSTSASPMEIVEESASGSSSSPNPTMTVSTMPQHPGTTGTSSGMGCAGSGFFLPPKGKGGVVKAFPIKLHDMLDAAASDSQLASVVSWQPHGRAFVVRQHKVFASDIMPQYFKQTKFASFQRQLNLYGFRRFTQGKDKGGYYHESFLRGMRHLTGSMIRMKVKGTRVRQATRPECQPDFYDMPPLPPLKTQTQNAMQHRRHLMQRAPVSPVPPPPPSVVVQTTPRPERIESEESDSSSSSAVDMNATATITASPVVCVPPPPVAAVAGTPPLRPLPAPVSLGTLAPLALSSSRSSSGTGQGCRLRPRLVTPPTRRTSLGGALNVNVAGQNQSQESQQAPPRPPAPPLAQAPSSSSSSCSPPPLPPPLALAAAASPLSSSSSTSTSSTLTASMSQVSLSSVDSAGSSSSSTSTSSCSSCPLILPGEETNPHTATFLEGLYEMVKEDERQAQQQQQHQQHQQVEAAPQLHLQQYCHRAQSPMAVEASVSVRGDGVCYFAGKPFYYIEDLSENDL